MMNEKKLRELEYEREMQEQADDIERWKLRKEIKKKLRALRKKVKADEASLPQLQNINEMLDKFEKSIPVDTQENLRENKENVSTSAFPKSGITAEFTPVMMRIFKESYTYDASCVDLDTVLPEIAAQMGKALLEEEAIEYKVYNDNIIGQRCVDMIIRVVVDDKC